MREIHLNEHDQFIYEHEIRPCLPDRIFDAHTHLLASEFHPRIDEWIPLARDPMLNNVDARYMQAWWRALFPDAEVSGLLMGFPSGECDQQGENEFVAQQAKGANLPFSLLVHPERPASEIEEDIQRLKPSGLKPYKVYVRTVNPEDASITDIIPESQIALADKYGLAITLHVARPQGMGAPENLRDIARLVHEYPKCNFILAHCGRCFITPNMEAALEQLPVAENLWLDTSAVCDMGVFLHLLDKYDRSRILFGTDLVTATAFRGSYVRLGMSWHMCTNEMVTRPGGMNDKATFAAYESLCALCGAMRFLKVTEAERRSIFFGNACSLFNLD